jgi:hypothetical protein
MLSSGKPKRVVSQAPLKPTLCAADCGATVFYRTSSKIVCPACRPLRSIQKNRRAAEHRRRKHGVSKVKGTEVHCARCNASFIRAGIRRKYCKPCAPKAALERRYERWSKNPGLRVNALIANAIGLSLRGRKAGRTWESLVGYTLADLMRHLERQFIDGMSWANFGEWGNRSSSSTSEFHLYEPRRCRILRCMGSNQSLAALAIRKPAQERSPHTASLGVPGK